MSDGIEIEALFQDFDLPEQRNTEIERLLAAIRERTYPSFYTLLKRRKGRFGPQEAFELCITAVRGRLTLRAFTALLGCCPPLEEFLHAGSAGCEIIGGRNMVSGEHGLTECAAAWDRADILKLLLRRGGNLNRDSGFELSPLEAAIEGRALHSVELLVQEPELDTALTPRLLASWSHMETGEDLLDFCLQAAAPRLTGAVPGPAAPIPVPRQLTVVNAASAGNWELAARICRERGSLPPEEARGLLDRLEMYRICPPEDSMSGFFGMEDPELMERKCTGQARALDALLARCPELLRGQQACRTVAALILYHYGTTAEILAPWAEKIRNRKISLYHFPWRGGCLDVKNAERLLDLWQKYLPDGPRPRLDRRMSILVFGRDGEEIRQLLGRMLKLCAPPRGKAPDGRLSALAELLMCYGSPGMVEEQLRPGGLLAGEHLEVMLSPGAHREIPLANRAIAASCMRKEADYAL